MPVTCRGGDWASHVDMSSSSYSQAGVSGLNTLPRPFVLIENALRSNPAKNTHVLYTHTHTPLYIGIHTHSHVLYTHTHTPLYIGTHTHSHVLYTHTHTHTPLYIGTHTHSHVLYTHTHTHTPLYIGTHTHHFIKVWIIPSDSLN